MDTFIAVGKYHAPKVLVEDKGKDGKSMLKLTIPIYSKRHNSTTYTSLIGSPQPTVKAPSAIAKGERIEIPWKDRFNQDNIDSVANFAKYHVSYIGEEKREYAEFLTPYDMIEFVGKLFERFNNETTMRINGRFKRNVFTNTNGTRIFNQFDIQSIYIYGKDEDIPVEMTSVKAEILYNKDSLIEGEIKNEYILSGYVNEYINKELQTKYVPLCPIYDLNSAKKNIDEMAKNGNTEGVEKSKKIIDSMLRYLKSGLPSDGKFVRMQWEMIYFRGADDVELTEEMLTPAQMEEVLIGERTLEDFKTRAVGATKEELKIYKKVLTGDYADGFVVTALSKTDVDNEVYLGKDVTQEKSYVQKNDEEDYAELRDLFNL